MIWHMTVSCRQKLLSLHLSPKTKITYRSSTSQINTTLVADVFSAARFIFGEDAAFADANFPSGQMEFLIQ